MRSGPLVRLSILSLVAAIIAGCSPAPPLDTDDSRRQILEDALTVAAVDPVRGAELFRQAGPGPDLEFIRFESWADCLERSGAEAAAWREYLADRPPQGLADTARLKIIEEMVNSNDLDAVREEREFLDPSRQPEVDGLLLRANNESARDDAARRLAIADPNRLRRIDRSLEQGALRSLSPEDRLKRATVLRSKGSAARAASELRSQSWRGEIEVRRRRELARADIESGAPLRALRVVPASTADAEDLTVRAQAYRSRAWTLWPAASGRRVFGNCHDTARRAVEAGAEGAVRQNALTLALECATESGRLRDALSYWWALEAVAWQDTRRGWLGRRLGIALARQGDSARAVAELARAIPTHRRALRFWLAEAEADGTETYRELTQSAIPDLYALWSHDRLQTQGPASLNRAAEIEQMAPPESVQRLVESDAMDDAVRQWRRIGKLRSTTPAEALGAAQLAQSTGFPMTAIRWLRAGFPDLGTADTANTPANALEAYLPLRWSDTLAVAARESRIQPWLIAAIARQESGFVAHARSPRGAIGVLQLIPSTARGHARALGLEVPPNLTDPHTNIRLGAREIAYLVRRFGAVEPALAAYNGGETRTRRWWRRQSDRRLFTEEIPIPETYNYIRRVTYLSEAYRLVYRDKWRSKVEKD